MLTLHSQAVIVTILNNKCYSYKSKDEYPEICSVDEVQISLGILTHFLRRKSRL